VPRWAQAKSKDGPPPKAVRSARALVVAFWGLLAGYRSLLWMALAPLIVSVALALATPYVTKLAIDHAVEGRPMPAWLSELLPVGLTPAGKLWLLGGAVAVFGLVAAVLPIPGRYQMTRLVQLVQARLRRRVFAHVARLPLDKVQALKSGGVTSLLREDPCNVADLIFIGVYNPFRAVLTFVGGLAAMATIDYRLLVGALAALPAVWITHRTWIARIRPVFSAIKQTRQVADGHATEVFAGMRVVRTYGGLFREGRRQAVATHLQGRQQILVWWWSRAVEAFWVVLIPVASAGVLVYGGLRVIEGSLTVGAVMAFGAYLLMLLGPMELLVGTASQLQNGLASLDRCLDALDEPREFAGVRAGGGAGAGVGGGGVLSGLTKARAHVRVEGVSFSYPGSGEVVLSEVSLEVRAGQTLALVGPSGSGKTTLCNLIARFYDPTHGRVTLEVPGRAAVDLRDIPAEAYRRLLGIVEQDVFLFDGTIAQNIAYGRRDATPEQIARAAEAANATEFIQRQARGMETLIGERGVRLSGGQRQRLAIARAVLADPAILILDEATSNLDSESERLIQQALGGLMKGRTCVVIAHRLSTVRHADKIVVLERGRIVESGTHEELLARPVGRYQRMLHAQVDPLALEQEAGGGGGPAGV
jgi:ATP-binding cassette subfamily B protein/subfamily B ATP-binding cassette protein MsbA